MTGASTVHQIMLDGTRLRYTFTRKSVKRINLRVDSAGEVWVSAPHSLPFAHVEAFMREKSDAILRSIRRVESRMASAPAPLRLEEGEKVLYFGSQLILHLARGKASFTRTADTVTLTLPNPEDPAAIRRLFGRWQACELRPVVETMANRFPIAESLTFRFRAMTSRWGSCRPAGRIITLNTGLAGAPLPCVEYVLLHELTHLHHPDHSSRFYDKLSVRLPDWKERKAELDRLARQLIPQKTKNNSL